MKEFYEAHNLCGIALNPTDYCDKRMDSEPNILRRSNMTSSFNALLFTYQSGYGEDSVLVTTGLIECPVEKDGSLLLSTVQAQLPAASGLWVQVGSKKRGMRYDSKTGKIYPPSEGWGDRHFQVSFATAPRQHGCLAMNSNFSMYESATKSFQNSVDAVQALMNGKGAGTDIDYELPAASEEKIVEKLKQQIYTLMAKNEQLQNTTDFDAELRNENERLSKKITELEKNGIQSNGIEEVVTVEKVNQNYAQNNNDTSESREFFEDKIEQLANKLNAKLDGENKLKQQIDEINSRYTNLEQTSTSKEEEHWKSLQVAQEQLRHQDEVICDLREQLANVDTSSEDSNQLKSNLQNAEHQINQANGKIGELEAEIQTVKTQLTECGEKCGKCEWDLGEHRQWLTESNNRIQQLESILSGKDNEINAIHNSTQSLKDKFENFNTQKEHYESRIQELESMCGEKEGAINRMNVDLNGMRNRLNELNNSRQEVQRQSSNQNLEGMFDMSNELKLAHQKKYELEGQTTQLQLDLKDAKKRKNDMENEIKSLQEQLWLANESKAKLEYTQGVVTHEKDEMSRTLSETQEKLGWLEGELNAMRGQSGEASEKCGALTQYKEKASRHLWDSFLVRKEPFFDRNKWILAMWNDDKDLQYVRVWFEVDAPNARHVYLMSSFFNWECALLCTMHDHGKWGVWVDVPRGRHEFRFLVDGHWKCIDAFPTCPNEFGSDNNWRVVE